MRNPPSSPTQAFDPVAATPPEKFAGKLVYFAHTDKREGFSALQGKLVLTTTQEPMSHEPGEEDDMAIGVVINGPAIPFREHFGVAAKYYSQKFQFMRVMDSHVEGYDLTKYHEEMLTTFIMRNDPSITKFDKNAQIFGEFRAQACETMDDLIGTASFINQQKDILIVSGQFAINHRVLEWMVAKDYAVVRDVTADILFYPNVARREAIAFPEHVPKGML